MKISVDGGALCGPRFGNCIFSENLIQAISKYDRENEYFIYTFCKANNHLSNKIHLKKLTAKLFQFQIISQELKEKKDIFLALNQVIPPLIKTKVIAFSHGLSFYFFPQLYPDSYSNLKKQLENMLKRSDKIIVSSEKVKTEILATFPWCKNIQVIPFGIPFDMLEKKETKRDKFFLFVGMDHPIKNVGFLIKAFRHFVAEMEFEDYRLYLVGDDFQNVVIQQRSLPTNIRVIPSLIRLELKKLYSRATAYLTTSFYESFNLPVLEALSQGCQVVALQSAIIPELKKYVYEAKDIESFVNMMEQVARGKTKKIDIDEIRKNFSWENYIKKLVTTYD